MSEKNEFFDRICSDLWFTRYIIHYDLPKSFEGQSLESVDFGFMDSSLQGIIKKLVVQVVMAKYVNTRLRRWKRD